MNTIKVNWKPASQYNDWDNGKWLYPDIAGDIMPTPMGPNPIKLIGVGNGPDKDLGYLCDVVFVAGGNVYDNRMDANMDTYAFGGVIPCGRGDDAAIKAAKAKINARIMASINQD